jgi:serine/threonine protein kinase
LQPFVPGFITGGTSMSASGSAWSAVRNVDGHPFVLKVIVVDDLTRAQALACEQMAEYDRIGGEHLVRRHSAVATADGRLALVLDDVRGGSLAQLLGARGQLTAGETVTTVAPLFRALADLHAAGVVHGDLGPGNVLFRADGRPLIGDLGVAQLLGSDADSSVGTETVFGTGTGGFSAPELACGAAPSPASDIYAMAALGWFCLTGAAPAPAATRGSLTSLRPDTPLSLLAVLTACLATNPVARPSAAAAAVEVFEAAPAESVALASVSDPGAEITRRIRAAAASDFEPVPLGARRVNRARLVVGGVVLLVLALGAGAAWFLGRPSVEATPVAAPSVARPSLQPALLPSTAPARQSQTVQATMPATMRTTTPTTAAPSKPSQSLTDVLTESDSPRVAAANLLQALVDARALAYVARDAALLDLLYAPGAPEAGVDEGNIATALKNGGTYLGLSFVLRDVALLDGTAQTARIRATIITPAYHTGQPDGRKIAHPQEILGPCVFSLSLTPDGWRILALTVP